MRVLELPRSCACADKHHRRPGLSMLVPKSVLSQQKEPSHDEGKAEPAVPQVACNH